MGGLFDSDLIPLLFVLVMLANVFLDRRNRRRRQQEQPQEQPQEQQPTQAEQQTQAKPKDIAAEFERRLKKTTEAAQARKRQSSQGVVHDGTRVRRDDGSRVHRDGEAMHDHTGRIHRENEDLVHDRGKVYYDPRSDYSYDEAKMNAAAAAFNAHYAQQAQPASKKRVKLKHAALVNGIIMAEVLGKPRALNPYEER
ncbi:hypothetical protein [Phascolarctobacterium succinatutens]|uniref:hypothetical protein n=1 Tax=Phascolarctobacterium succinatutens TaxID=626940 RepID=UPI0026EDCD3D|nr:hypothetical protein [Phascolarctobacterium succinatutens]